MGMEGRSPNHHADCSLPCRTGQGPLGHDLEVTSAESTLEMPIHYPFPSRLELVVEYPNKYPETRLRSKVIKLYLLRGEG